MKFNADRRCVIIISFLLCAFVFPLSGFAGTLPKGFVYVKDVIPDAVIELRYCSDDNFVGRRVDGYVKPRCIMTEDAAKALKRVQEDLKCFSLGIKIYDAYRPQRAVNHFVRWARDLNDRKMKVKYYPSEAKATLFKKGYIAHKSGHSRGSTVDLTIVSFDKTGTFRELDMGTGFDFFSTTSWPDDPTMTPGQRAHRMLLQTVMEKQGFKPYSKEWWHFTLTNEPYPDTYFDFPIE